MSEDVDMTVSFGAEEPLVEFPLESLTVSIPITQMSEGLYRLDGVPFGVESASFGDIIEAELCEDGRLRFMCVAEPGGWRTFQYLLSAQAIEFERVQSLLRELEARGGHWERMFGGLLCICIPPGLDLDPAQWLESD